MRDLPTNRAYLINSAGRDAQEFSWNYCKFQLNSGPGPRPRKHPRTPQNHPKPTRDAQKRHAAPREPRNKQKEETSPPPSPHRNVAETCHGQNQVPATFFGLRDLPTNRAYLINSAGRDAQEFSWNYCKFQLNSGSRPRPRKHPRTPQNTPKPP